MQLCLQILSCHKKITYYMSQIQSYTLHLVFVDTYYLLSLPCLICRLVIIKTCCTYFDSSFLIFAIYGFIFITHFLSVTSLLSLLIAAGRKIPLVVQKKSKWSRVVYLIFWWTSRFSNEVGGTREHTHRDNN